MQRWGRSVCLVERATFDEDRGADVVAASQIGQEFGKQILQAAKDHLEEGMDRARRGARRQGRQHPLPEVMVRIDDRQIRLQDGFTTHGCSLLADSYEHHISLVAQRPLPVDAPGASVRPSRRCRAV